MTETPMDASPQYWMPPEWAPHKATWLSYPHTATTWPGGIDKILAPYHDFIRVISAGETVHIHVQDAAAARRLKAALASAGAVMDNVVLHEVPTNDAWCRDHGPCFCMARETAQKVVINWGFNAWGGKYPFVLDDRIPAYDAQFLNLPLIAPGLIMEGGAIDVNGAGCLLTTESCLLNPNRNPACAKADIEAALNRYYGAEQVIWLGEGLAGDDTDGHVDDMTRFVSETKVVTAVETDPADINYEPLRYNLEVLQRVRLSGDVPLHVVELPMPAPVYYDGQRLPASYANFYICNAAVIVPTFRCAQDAEALAILKTCFDRPVIGLDSYDIVQGLGSFHCLSRQEPHGNE